MSSSAAVPAPPPVPPAAPRLEGLSVEQLQQVFPFLLVVDGQLRVLAAGPAWPAACPEVGVGSFLDQHLRLEFPREELSAAQVQQRRGQQVHLCFPPRALVWRGQFLDGGGPGCWLFAGTPWVTDLEQAEALGLDGPRAAPHDVTWDLLELARRAQPPPAPEEGAREQRLRRMVDHAREALFLADLQGRWTQLGAAWTRITGFPREEFLGQPLTAPLHPEDRPAVVEHVRQLLERRVPEFRVNARCRTRGGVDRWVEISARLVQDTGLLEPGIAGSLADVTDRVLVEQTLRDSESAFRGMVQHAAEGIMTVDARSRILFANTAAATIFGYAPGALLGMDARALAPDMAVLALGEGAAGRSRSGVFRPVGAGGEVQGVRKDGSTFPLYMAASSFRLSGGRFHAAILRDLTDQRRADVELRAAKAAAESANRAKSDFLATVSHEIRTPLNAILGMTDLARTTASAEDRDEFLGRAAANAQALLGLINEMLDLSRIEAGQLDLHVGSVDLAALAQEVADSLAARAAAKSLALVLAVDPRLPAAVAADPQRLRQIMVNLVGNAVKFTDQGEVCLALDVTAPGAGQVELHVQVSDTGPGIHADDLGRVFDKFFRADASTTRRHGGTGLGLTISRSLVQLLGGRMWAESQPGEGSTFHVNLPLTVLDAPEPAPLPGLAPRLLVLGPQDALRRAVVRTLSHHGFTTLAARDVEEARRVALAGESPVAAVLVDAAMPDAQAGLARLRLTPALQDSRTVWLAPLGTPLPPGVDHLAVTPLGNARLLHAVARVLELPGAARGLAPPPAALPAVARPHRVLLVEDNPDNQTVARVALQRAGFRVDVVGDGAQAVHQADQVVYDLVLMDVEMPVMDGLQATREIRARETWSGRERVPIVAVTAHALEGFRQRCLDHGVDDYVPKPVTPHVLLEVADRWLDARPRVLVADDSEDSRFLLKAVLDREGCYRVVVVNDGQEALDAFARCTFHAVLLDMEMPVLDGYATARALRAQPLGATLPILALTGHEGSAEQAKCLEAGCSHYLVKPFHRANLVKVLSDALGLEGKPGSKTPPAAELPR